MQHKKSLIIGSVLLAGVLVVWIWYAIMQEDGRSHGNLRVPEVVHETDVTQTEDDTGQDSTTNTASSSNSVFGFAPMPSYMPTSTDVIFGVKPWMEPEQIIVTKPVSLQDIETKTHNSKFGYKITYPSTWYTSFDDTTVKLTDINGSRVEVFSIFPPNGDVFMGSPILIEVLKISFNDYLKEFISIPTIPVVIDGVTAYRFEQTVNDSEFLFLQKKDEGYLIRVFLTHYGNVPPEDLLWVLSTIAFE